MVVIFLHDRSKNSVINVSAGENHRCIRPLKQMSILLECGIDHCAVWLHNSFLILDDLCGGSGRLVVVHQKNVLQHVGVIKGELCASSNQALQQRFAVC